MRGSENECGDHVQSKKRKKTGRLSEVGKKIKLSTHESGKPCNCSRYKCFINSTEKDRTEILNKFNAMTSHDE